MHSAGADLSATQRRLDERTPTRGRFERPVLDEARRRARMEAEGSPVKLVLLDAADHVRRPDVLVRRLLLPRHRERLRPDLAYEERKLLSRLEEHVGPAAFPRIAVDAHHVAVATPVVERV